MLSPFFRLASASLSSGRATRFLSRSASLSTHSGAAPARFTLKRGDKYTVDCVMEEKVTTGKFVQEATTRQKHTQVVDERGLYGGADLGPSPYDLLLSALGGCTSMTLRMYADRRGLALPPLRIELMHAKVPRGDVPELSSGAAAGSQVQVDLFEVSLSTVSDAEPPLTTDQQTHLVDIAGRCPVHKTLAGNPNTIVRTRWAA